MTDPYFQYIRQMPNISKVARKRELSFIEDVARLLVPWGMPPLAARLYGYLLLASGPVSLDQMTTGLGVSKSSASVAAKLLVSYGLAYRHREAGTKRALYAVAEDYEAMIEQQNRLLDALAALLKDGVAIAGSKEAGVRLDEMARFFSLTRNAMEDAIGRWKSRRSGGR